MSVATTTVCTKDYLHVPARTRDELIGPKASLKLQKKQTLIVQASNRRSRDEGAAEALQLKWQNVSKSA